MDPDRSVLVTGGAGYIGSACAAALAERGRRVVVLDNLSKGQADKVHPKATFIEGDVTDRDLLDKVFNEYDFGSVIHLAALKSVEESESDPEVYFQVNVTGTLDLLAAMDAHGVPELVFSSTAAVYAPLSDIERFSEDSPLDPINVYGRTKLIAEMCIKDYARTGKLKRYSILRYFNVAGDTGLNYREKDAKNVFPILADALKNGETFDIFGTDYPTKDGTCVRDYIHLQDLVAAHLAALDHDHSGIFNLGTSKGSSVRELVDVFERVSGENMVVAEKPRRAGDPAILLADSSRAERELGWRPERTLADMVESTLHRSVDKS